MKTIKTKECCMNCYGRQGTIAGGGIFCFNTDCPCHTPYKEEECICKSLLMPSCPIHGIEINLSIKEEKKRCICLEIEASPQNKIILCPAHSPNPSNKRMS